MADVATEGVKYCVVCGAGSHRADWQSSTKPVACDTHTKEEVDAALAKTKKSSHPPAAPPEKPAS